MQFSVFLNDTASDYAIAVYRVDPPTMLSQASNDGVVIECASSTSDNLADCLLLLIAERNDII